MSLVSSRCTCSWSGYALTVFSRGPALDLAGVAFSIAAEILLNFCLMLTGQPISHVLAAGGVVAILGAVQPTRARGARSLRAEDRAAISSPAPWLAAALIITVYYVEILSEALIHWDARAIWFFHARMIWTEGALRATAGWAHPSITFSNPDYPEVVPALAAQLAFIKGFWNDVFPKGSLLIMLVR